MEVKKQLQTFIFIIPESLSTIALV